MRDIDNRRKILREHKIPEDYIDLYLFIITKDIAYLPEQYKTQKNTFDKSKLRKGAQDLAILFGRIIIDGGYNEEYLSY